MLRDIDLDAVERSFKKALAREGFAPAAFGEFYTLIGDLKRAAAQPEFITMRDLDASELAPLTHLFYNRAGGETRILTRFHPASGRRDSAWHERFKDAIGADGRTVRAASIGMAAQALGEAVLDKFRTISLAAALLVVVVLAVLFKSLPKCLLALLPLAVGTACTLGVMKLAGLSFNYANVVVLPVILGIGIDDGIHLVHHFHLDAERDVGRLLRSTGRAVVVTSLTTMIGFGALAWSPHAGVRSMGVLAALGVGLCLAASLCTLPAALALAERNRRRG